MQKRLFDVMTMFERRPVLQISRRVVERESDFTVLTSEVKIRVTSWLKGVKARITNA